MKKIAIVDDDRDYAEEIRKVIMAGKWRDTIRVDVYEDPGLFLDELQNGKEYDLCLSDIEMPGKSGLKLAGEIRRLDPYMLLVFLTAHSKYAICGYQVEAFDYILKGQFEEEWKRVQKKIEKAFKRLDNDYYLIEASTFFEKIPLSHILYIYKEEKYTVFVLEDRLVRMRKPLRQVQKELAGKNQFIQVERGHVVNIEKIKKFELREIELTNGKRIPIGKILSSEVRNKIHTYYSGRV